MAHQRRRARARPRRRGAGPAPPPADLERQPLELPAHIPTLAELFDACGSGYDLSLDVKDAAAGPTVIATVAEVAPDLLAPAVALPSATGSRRPLRARSTPT